METEQEAAALCNGCGACCAFSREWPRFTTEDDVALDRIPREFADHDSGFMRCNDDRCAALQGQVGVATSCAIYSVRPDVCRACQPGDDACEMARRRLLTSAAGRRLEVVRWPNGNKG